MHDHQKNTGKGCLKALNFWRLSKSGQSTIEFAVLIIFILLVLLFFQKYIARGIGGRWKAVGDTIGHGRIYDANYTVECEFFPGVGWYDRKCYENSCRSSCGPPASCTGCLSSCKSSFCE